MLARSHEDKPPPALAETWRPAFELESIRIIRHAGIVNGERHIALVDWLWYPNGNAAGFERFASCMVGQYTSGTQEGEFFLSPRLQDKMLIRPVPEAIRLDVARAVIDTLRERAAA